MSEFYDFTLRTLQGQPFSLSDFRGEAVLVVNTASRCGFTPQYKELEELYLQYVDQGLVILGCPCNQFGGQEPGTAEEIQRFCLTHYGVTFPITEKLRVKGKSADPLFQWLTSQLPGLLWPGVKWNFTKFLISRDGSPIKRYSPFTSPAKIRHDIERILS